MYKAEKTIQMTFEDFNQSCGMKLNVRDEWIVVADSIDWAAVEEKYMEFFPSKRGRPALSARMALGALIIQHKAKLSDRNLVKEVSRNPYYQYFIGLESYRTKCPFGHGVLPELRKRFGMDFINEVNEVVVKNARPTPEHADDKEEKPSANGNLGTMILDATCSPSNIRYPQDFSLLNEAREKLDGMIDKLHGMVDEPRYPKRVLVDQVYRTKENRAYCEERGVVMSGRKPGRPPEDDKKRRKAEKVERKNDVDRIEVERFFSRDKRSFGAGLIMTKLSNTTLGSIALAVLVANLFGAGLSFFVFYFMDAPDGVASFDLVEVQDDAA